MWLEAQMSDSSCLEKVASNPTANPATANTIEGLSEGAKPGKATAGISKTLESLPIDIETVTDPMIRQAMIVLYDLVVSCSS